MTPIKQVQRSGSHGDSRQENQHRVRKSGEGTMKGPCIVYCQHDVRMTRASADLIRAFIPQGSAQLLSLMPNAFFIL